MLLKFLGGLAFLVVALILAFSLSTLSSFFEKRLLSKLQPAFRYGILICLTILFEAGLIELLAFGSKWSLIDSWFTGSILLVAIIWLPAYFRPFQENASRTIGKFHRGSDAGGITIHKGRSRHPFVIGTLLFSAVGMIVSISYYLPYFI